MFRHPFAAGVGDSQNEVSIMPFIAVCPGIWVRLAALEGLPLFVEKEDPRCCVR